MDRGQDMAVKIYEFEYSSGIGEYIASFVRQKRVAGYPYNESARILQYFDHMIFEEFPEAETITKQIIDCWISHQSQVHQNTLLRRMTPVRQLSVYMSGLGIETYIVPGHIPDKQIRYDPHIYTKEELIRLFEVIDDLPVSVFSPYKRYIAPVLFRFCFLCGMRLSETINLKTEDVDADNGIMTIQESKSWKKRKIFLSDELTGMVKEYDEIISKIVPNRKMFFPAVKGDEPIHPCSIDLWFRLIKKEAFRDNDHSGKKMRIHDLRHTYATERLNRWVEEEIDVSVMYPYFSRYLGHSNFYDTDYYLKLAPSFYPEMNKRMKSLNSQILPEVIDENL